MATRKTTAAAEVKPAETEKPAAKTAAKPAAKKTASKTGAKKPAAKTAAKKTTKTAATKPAVKKAAVETVKVQFAGNEYDAAAIVEAVKAAYKAQSKAAIKSLEVYIKPEDGAAYYVVNDKVSGKVDL